MAAVSGTYVDLTDLDRTYTTKTHPTLVQVTQYVSQANDLLSAWLSTATATDNYNAIKDVGIEIVENKIHNRKVRDHIEGYQFYRPNGLTMDMKDSITARTQPWASPFTFYPAGDQI